MMEVWFGAVEKFDPQSGDSWRKYIECSGLTQLKEIVSLDDCLCPDVIDKLTDEDWKFSVGEDYVYLYFRDLDYLLNRVAKYDRVNILAVIRNPDGDCKNYFRDERFEFMGYDLVEVNGSTSALTNYLVEVNGSTSALTNCGGFTKAFRNEELSNVGLISSFERALEVRGLLRKRYPEEPHANCDLWAIWKMKKEPKLTDRAK